MILVTGGTGMLGSNLLLELSKNNNPIIAIKRINSSLELVRNIFQENNLINNFNRINWIDLDLLDYFKLDGFFKINDISEVYHCAAQISYKKSDDKMLLDNNVTSTSNIVNLSLQYKIKKLCYVSSIASLGIAERGFEINENTEFDTESKSSGYSVSKYYAELEVWRGIAEGLNAVIVNPSVILGSGNWKSGSSSLFSTINKGLKFYTKGITGFVDVVDVVSIMILLMKSEVHSERFIVNSENSSYYELFNLIAKSLNKKAPSIYANKYLTAFAWRFEYLKSILTSKQPVITSNSARTSHKTLVYSNKKILDVLDYNFVKIADSVKKYSEIFLKQINA